MAERTRSARSRDFYTKTSDLVRAIQDNHENKDFHINLLIHRLDKAFECPPPFSVHQCIRGFPEKIPNSSIMDDCNTCKENLAVKCILIVATIVESFKTILHSREDCWNLVAAMYKLAKCFYQLKDFPILNDLHKIKNVEADPVFSTIVDASYTCFFQKNEKKYDRLVLNPRKYYKDIQRHLHRVNGVYDDLGTQMHVYMLRFEQQRLRSGGESLEHGNVKEDKTERAIFHELKDEEEYREGKVKTIVKFLNLKSHKEKHLAVVVQGDSGQSKTNLVEAVYDRLEVELFFEGWKLIKKILTENMEFQPNVEELHSEIVNLFAPGKKKKTHSGKMSENIPNEPVFICIDNILRAQDLRNILDMELLGPKKVRLLVTSPNKSVNLLLEKYGFKCNVVDCAEENWNIGSEYGKDPLIREVVDCAEDNRNVGSECSNDPQLHCIPRLREVARDYLNRSKGVDKETVCKRVDENNLVETGFHFALENAFRNLPVSAKDAVLDISSFFLGWDWDEVSLIVGEAELETLEANAWVKRNRSNQIVVQDFICSQCLSRTKGERLTSKDDLIKALSSDEAIKQVKGIWLPDDNQGPVRIPADKLELMRETLRVISLGCSTVVDGNCYQSFQKLRFLRVGRSSKKLPFTLNQLRILSYFSCDEDVDFNLYQLPPELKIVVLCGDEKFRYNSGSDGRKEREMFTCKMDSLRTLKIKNFKKLAVPEPKIFRPYDRLKELSISTCSVIELPESLTQLYLLKTLDLHDCKYLRKLPKSFGALLYLIKLNLSNCSSLKSLPESFGHLQSLEELILSYCSGLKQLPASFVCLSALKKATFLHCHNMHKLPEKFELLSCLEEVNFSYCKSLKLLPVNFELLSSLQLLNLDGCSELEKVPDNYPESLFRAESVAIMLSGCSKLTELQDEFFQGNNIEDLSLAYCTSLESLPSQINQLKQLIYLNLCDCKKLRKLPNSFSELPCLEALNLSSCRKLRNLCKGFNRLRALKDLNLSDCPVLKGKWMKKVKRIKSLRIVDIHGSYKLMKIWSQGPRDFTVITKESMPDDYIKKILRKTASKFFTDKAILVGKDGKPFFPSREISSNTTMALIFDHNISRWGCETLEVNVDMLLTNLNDMQIIYVGKSFSAIPTKLAEKITAYTPDNSEALSFFDKALSITAGPDFWHFRTYIVKTTVVERQRDYKHFEGWGSISGALLGKNFRIQDYRRLEEMFVIGSKQDSNLEELQQLFKTQENMELVMLQNNNKVTISDLKGKMVFLLISTPEISKSQILSLIEIYEEMRDKQYSFEVEWLWIPVTVGDINMKITDYEGKTAIMPWVVISKSMIDKSTIAIFFRDRMGFCEMPLLVSLAPSSRISVADVIPMLAILGSEAWLFLNIGRSSSKDAILNKKSLSTKDEDELAKLKSLSYIQFLFRHFTDIGQQLSSFQMIWLYGGDPEKISEFNSKLSRVRDQMDKTIKIHIVYVSRGRFLHDTNSIQMERYLHDTNTEQINSALHDKNTSNIKWSKLFFEEVKRFWHHINYLVYLIAFEKEINKLEAKKFESLQRLLLGLLSLDCLSRRNKSVWMMAVDGITNEIFTGRGKELVDLLSSNIDESIKSRIELRDGEGVVYSDKLLQGPLVEVIQNSSSTSSEVEDGKRWQNEQIMKQEFEDALCFSTSSEVEDGKRWHSEQVEKQSFEDALWFRAHPSSHLVEQISANTFCSMCYSGDPVHHCDSCGCFNVCEKCYIWEFIERSKKKHGDQINIEVAQ